MNIWRESINLSEFLQKVLTAATVFVTIRQNLQRNSSLVALGATKGLDFAPVSMQGE